MYRSLDDPLRADMRRNAVAGTTGVGKSALASGLAECLYISHIEMDALYWMPDWIASEGESMRTRIRSATQAEAWVIDDNDSFLWEIICPRLQAVV